MRTYMLSMRSVILQVDHVAYLYNTSSFPDMASFQEVQTRAILSQEARTVDSAIWDLGLCWPCPWGSMKPRHGPHCPACTPASQQPPFCVCFAFSFLLAAFSRPVRSYPAILLGKFSFPWGCPQSLLKKVFIPDFSSNISAWSRCFDYLRAFYKGAGRKGSYDATVAWRGRMLWWFRLEAGSSVHIMVIQCYLLCLTVFLCKMKRKILPNWI